ncbi:RNA-binding protein Ro60 [Anopheles bellator]|uniref:RNA-binding protein Ro60 n=1 Tax=Anopheles bellator TaxID=139047 RepID=UPI0026498727|nr:RNA-binding protein Ro60 [Anopheles bellator]
MASVLATVQRYLYIGNDVPFFFDVTEPLDIELGKKVLAPAVKPQPLTPAVNGASKRSKKVPKLKNVEPAPKGEQTRNETSGSLTTIPVPPVLALIKKILRVQTVRRLDECLFALAYCSRELPTVEERHSVYAELPELLSGSHELFVFLEYYTRLATQSGYAGFGHGLRGAITRWYDKYGALELAAIVASSNSVEGWSHADVIRKTHLKLACPAKQAVIDAATKRTSQLVSYIALRSAEKKDPEKANENGAIMDALNRYRTLREIRGAPSAVETVEYINKHGAITFELIPKQFRRSVKVWEALFPHLTYRELLAAALPMMDFSVLKTSDSSITKAYINALSDRRKAIEKEKINAIEVHDIVKLFSNLRRYKSKLKEKQQREKKNTNIIPPFDIFNMLDEIADYSLSHHPKTGARYYIALDLRRAHLKKHVLRSCIVECIEASALMAFSIFKREKNVTVVAFAEDEKSLRPVEFRQDMTWSQALKHCKDMVLPKTKAKLTMPIQNAQTNKQEVDVFITITDSLVRINPLRSAPAEALLEYRKAMNLNLTRYVAVSLCYHKPSLEFNENSMKTGGILELVGYNASNAKLIEAFAKNLFF